MTTHEVLVAGRNLIDRDGWAQGWGGQGPGGERCASIACRDASGVSFGDYWGSWRKATEALLEAVGLPTDDPRRIGEWNDAPGRTKDDVLAAFDKAIAATAPAPADPFGPAFIDCTYEDVTAC